MNAKTSRSSDVFVILSWVALGLAVLMAISAVAHIARAPLKIAEFEQQGWGRFADVIVRNQIIALWHGAFMALLAFVFFRWWPRLSSRKALRWVPAIVILLDAVWLARHYVHTVPLSMFAENPVVRFLRTGPRESRVMLLTQEGFYNEWLTFLFPRYGIKAVNVTQMPRMPVDYRRFLENVGPRLDRYWQLAAVRHVVGPTALWQQVVGKDVPVGAAVPIASFDVFVANQQYIVQMTGDRGAHVILSVRNPGPYAALISQWEIASDDEALRKLSDPNWELFRSVLVAPESATDLPAANDSSDSAGTVSVRSYEPGHIVLDASVRKPALLRISEKFAPGWQATVNGRAATVRRVDYLFQGVYLEPGEHVIALRYARPSPTLKLMWAALAAWLVASIIALVRARATRSDRSDFMVFCAVILGAALLIFRGVLVPGRALFSTDDNLGHLFLRKQLISPWASEVWDDSLLVGTPSVFLPGWTHLLLWLLPPVLFKNWIQPLDLLLASLIFGSFLNHRGMRWPACAVGALTAFWLGSNLTLTFAGHIMKFGILLWASVFLWAVDQAARRRDPWFGALAGGALGLTFVEQADVALFFACVLGPYALLRLFEPTEARRTAVVSLLALLTLAGLVAFHAVWEGYRANVAGVAAVQTENPQEKWAFATQWSWPPEECIDFVAPGYMGWRSGEPAGPYWGRMGRSEGWERTGRGFMNFKLENQYLGFIPLLLAVAGIWASSGLRSERIFWTAATVVTLLLSFGKYFPLYALFYRLPFVSNIRNPNKFLQVFQMSLAVLSAIGLESLLERASNSSCTKPQDVGNSRRRARVAERQTQRT